MEPLHSIWIFIFLNIYIFGYLYFWKCIFLDIYVFGNVSFWKFIFFEYLYFWILKSLRNWLEYLKWISRAVGPPLPCPNSLYIWHELGREACLGQRHSNLSMRVPQKILKKASPYTMVMPTAFWRELALWDNETNGHLQIRMVVNNAKQFDCKICIWFFHLNGKLSLPSLDKIHPFGPTLLISHCTDSKERSNCMLSPKFNVLGAVFHQFCVQASQLVSASTQMSITYLFFAFEATS